MLQNEVQENNEPETVNTPEPEQPAEVDQTETAETPEQYSADNGELDAIIAAATATKDDETSESGESAPGSAGVLIGKDDAAKYAVMGVMQCVKFAGQYTGEPLQISKTQLHVFSMLLTPLIMKHGDTVMRQVEQFQDGVSGEGYMPELAAGVGVVGLGGVLYMKNRKIKRQKQLAKQKENAGGDDGD